MLDFGTDVIALARLIIIALEDGSATNWALAAVQGGFIALYLRLSTFIFAMCGASRVTFGWVPRALDSAGGLSVMQCSE